VYSGTDDNPAALADPRGSVAKEKTAQFDPKFTSRGEEIVAAPLSVCRLLRSKFSRGMIIGRFARPIGCRLPSDFLTAPIQRASVQPAGRCTGRKTSLADLCGSAGLERVPVDAYTNSSPLRMAQVGGQTVIYSVGPDGDDDGGLKDADMGRNPDGDFLFRPPKAASDDRVKKSRGASQ
jgi:hypothetical protein